MYSSTKQKAFAHGQAHRRSIVTRLAPLRRNTIVRLLALWLAAFLVLCSLFFTEILKHNNYLETFPKELVFPIIMHAGTAIWIAVLVYLIKRPTTMAAKLVSVTLLSLLMVGYDGRLNAMLGFFRAWVPISPQPDKDIPLLSLIFLALLVYGAVLVGRWFEKLQKTHRQLQTVNLVAAVFIVIGAMFFSQVAALGRVLPQIVRQSSTQAPALVRPPDADSRTPADKPDIFYIVLDRYTNADVLREQFGFDNSPFTNFLRQNDFYVKDNAYANYPYTAMSVASTLNADFTADFVAPYKDSDVQGRTLYHNLIRQSSVIRALKDVGYQYYNIGSWYGATNKAPLADRDYIWKHLLTVFGRDKRLRGIEASQFAQSPYHRLAKVSGLPWWPFNAQDQDSITDVRKQLNVLDDLTTKETAGGRFIFAHILVPHEPYNFNADGSIFTNNATDSIGRTLKEKYNNQVQFINTQMQELIANIQQQSGGKAIIVLSSDEGSYPQLMNDTFKQPTPGVGPLGDGITKQEDMRTWSQDWLKMKFGILQAVHIPGMTDEDRANLSSVNLFRIVLTRYFGYQLDYLPDCHFGIINGTEREFNYAEVSQGLLGYEANPSCQDLQNLPSDSR